MKKIEAFVFCVLISAVFFSCTTLKDSDRGFSLVPERMHQELLDSTVVSTGNNYRMKKVLEKMKSGEDVYVAALGGSVTEGLYLATYKNGYAYQFYRKLQSRFTDNGGANMHFVCAGLGGTPSIIGLIRYYKDIVQSLGHVPDLLVLEFSVNDDGSSINARAFEQLIRQALSADPETAVIALYSASINGNKSSLMIPIASHYDIPQVNVLELYERGISGGIFTKGKYFIDHVHPKREGHNLQAECLVNVISKISLENMDPQIAIPAEYHEKNPLDNFCTVGKDNQEIKIEPGSFSEVDPVTQTMKSTGKGDFPENWRHVSGNDAFVMDVVCKNLVVAFKIPTLDLSLTYGDADVFVDGKKVATMKASYWNGWLHCEYAVVIDDEKSSPHHVEIKMADGHSSRFFTILAIGYNK